MKDPAAPRLLFIAPQGLGDSLQLTPVLPGVRHRYPRARIDVVTLRPTATDLFRGLVGLVDRVIHLPYWTRGRSAFGAALARFLAFECYDASFLAYPAARREYHYLHALVRSRARFAHRYASFALDGLRATLRLDAVPGGNVARNHQLVAAYDSKLALADDYVVPEEWRARERASPGPVVVHVGSVDHDAFAAKRWPLPRFIDLARRLVACGEPVTYLSGPDEREATHDAYARTPGSQIFEGSLLATARFLDDAALVVTNDSGVGHLAAGLGRPVVSLFGPTSTDFAPYGTTGTALRPSRCRPCFDVRTSDMSCKLNIDYACLKIDLPVELVERTILERLSATRTAP